MARGNTDFSATLTRIAESGANTVVFQNTSGPASLALKNARDLGLDLRFACLNYCSNEVLVDLAGEAAEGVLASIIYSPPGEGVDGLNDAAEYLASKGGSIDEEGLLYGQGWAVASLVTEAIERAAAAGEVTGDSIFAAFETFDDWDNGRRDGAGHLHGHRPSRHQGHEDLRDQGRQLPARDRDADGLHAGGGRVGQATTPCCP